MSRELQSSNFRYMHVVLGKKLPISTYRSSLSALENIQALSITSGRKLKIKSPATRRDELWRQQEQVNSTARDNMDVWINYILPGSLHLRRKIRRRNEAGDSGKSYMVDKLASVSELSCKYELFSIRFWRGVGIEGSFGCPSWSAWKCCIWPGLTTPN